MTFSRAILLLTCLAAFAPAAPAPFPRERKLADTKGWSQPVDGLRVRLVAHRTRYRAGESVRLLMEVQNVSGSPRVIEEPSLSSLVTPSLVTGWSITYARLGKASLTMREKIRWTKRDSALHKLAAGATLRVEITAHGGGMLEAKQKELEREDEPRREDVFFSEADTPGVYELRATFSPRRARKGEVDVKALWGKNSLTSPPVRIEIHE